MGWMFSNDRSPAPPPARSTEGRRVRAEGVETVPGRLTGEAGRLGATVVLFENPAHGWPMLIAVCLFHLLQTTEPRFHVSTKPTNARKLGSGAGQIAPLVNRRAGESRRHGRGEGVHFGQLPIRPFLVRFIAKPGGSSSWSDVYQSRLCTRQPARGSRPAYGP